MVDPLSYASVDLSTEVFDGALAMQGLNKPIKKRYAAKFQLLLTFFYTI